MRADFEAPVEIRKDFESAAPYLHRLWGIGGEFSTLNNERWPHMKHREDFRRAYSLEEPRRLAFEDLYGTGRDIAGYMSWHLRNFNDVGEFPTLTSYVDSFRRNWSANVERYEARLAEFKVHAEPADTPWAVRQMIDMWEQQLRLLHAVNETVELLKQTDIYRIENGELRVSDLNKPTMNIGVIGDVHHGKVNVGSVDSSTNINVTTHQVFTSLRDALNNAELPASDRAALLRHVDAMQTEVGKPGFVKHYQDFVTAAANHMTVLSPFFPALAGLLS